MPLYNFNFVISLSWGRAFEGIKVKSCLLSVKLHLLLRLSVKANINIKNNEWQNWILYQWLFSICSQEAGVMKLLTIDDKEVNCVAKNMIITSSLYCENDTDYHS